MSTRTTSEGLKVITGGAWSYTSAAGVPSGDSVNAALARLRSAAASAAAAKQSAADLLAIAQSVPGSGDSVVPPSGAGPQTVPYRDADNLFGWKPVEDVIATAAGWKTPTGVDTAGVADASPAVQSAVNAAAQLGYGVLLPSGRIKLASTVNLPDGTVVRSFGSTTIDLSALGSSPAFAAVGQAAAEVRLTATAAEGSTVCTLTSAASLSPGDTVKIGSTTVASSVTNQPVGEIQRVRSISGNVLTFADPLSRTYTVEALAAVQRLDQRSRIRIEGLHFEGVETSPTTTSCAIKFDTCRNVSVRSCAFRWVHYISVWLTDTQFARISDCHFADALNTGTAYGVACHWATQDVTVTGCTSIRVRHQVTCGGGTSRRGTSRRITVSGCTATESIDAAFDAHCGCDLFAVTGCHVLGGGQDGIIAQGRQITISGNTVVGVARHGIFLQGNSIGGLHGAISGNCVSRAGGRGIYVLPDSVAAHQQWSGVAVTGNDVTDAASTGIELAQTSTEFAAEGFAVTGNSVRRGKSHGIHLRGVRDCTVSGNHVADVPSGSSGIYLLNVLGLCGVDFFDQRGRRFVRHSPWQQLNRLHDRREPAPELFDGRLSGRVVWPGCRRVEQRPRLRHRVQPCCVREHREQPLMPKVTRRIHISGSALIYGHHALACGLGAYGLVAVQSPTVDRFIGGVDGSFLWSLLFAVFGAIALLARLSKWLGWLDLAKAEVVCVLILAIVGFLWGGLFVAAAFLDHDSDTIQVGLTLARSSFFLSGASLLHLANERQMTLAQQDHAAEILAHVEHEIRRGSEV